MTLSFLFQEIIKEEPVVGGKFTPPHYLRESAALQSCTPGAQAPMGHPAAPRTIFLLPLS